MIKIIKTSFICNQKFTKHISRFFNSFTQVLSQNRFLNMEEEKVLPQTVKGLSTKVLNRCILQFKSCFSPLALFIIEFLRK